MNSSNQGNQKKKALWNLVRVFASGEYNWIRIFIVVSYIWVRDFEVMKANRNVLQKDQWMKISIILKEHVKRRKRLVLRELGARGDWQFWKWSRWNTWRNVKSMMRVPCDWKHTWVGMKERWERWTKGIFNWFKIWRFSDVMTSTYITKNFRSQCLWCGDLMIWWIASYQRTDIMN